MRLAAAIALSFALACGGDDDGGGDNLADALGEIPGLTFVEEEVEPPYRFFWMEYEQPVDHGDPDGATFRQRLTLVHLDAGAPTVLHTTGYHLVGGPFLSELAYLIDANQVHVEQRFFGPSRPEPADWSLLDIEQAAADHHRIIEALAPLYGGAWVSTGASKGGMTSIYHRRFYPDDVDGTVAYVAPISFGAPDERYLPFFDTVGEDTCREAIRAYQREMLVRREEMLIRMEAYADGEGITYERMGGIAGAFEDSVIEFQWGFWQYQGADSCVAVPSTTATDDELWSFYMDSDALFFFGDGDVLAYEPYYYQADTQLGYPDIPTDHLADLLVTQDEPRDFLPAGVEATYDPDAMVDIDAWVKAEGAELIFVYGEWDPWTAGRFELGDATDSASYLVPAGTHGATILDLADGDQAEIADALERWTGYRSRVKPSSSATSVRSLPSMRAAADRSIRVRHRSGTRRPPRTSR